MTSRSRSASSTTAQQDDEYLLALKKRSETNGLSVGFGQLDLKLMVAPRTFLIGLLTRVTALPFAF